MNGIPDECEIDCNDNGVPDDCDLDSGFSFDCNSNLIPDECDTFSGFSLDCNSDQIPDLAIGAPGWDGDNAGIGVGIVFVVPGSRTVMPPNIGEHGSEAYAGFQIFTTQ